MSQASAPTGTRTLAIDGGEPVFETAVPFMAVGLTDSDVAAATEVLRSGMLRAASKCAALEERFAELSGARHAMACANGTCALQLAYGATIKPGDEVLVPAWTYIATASMVAAAGATPVFCDVHEDSYQIDLADAEKRITDKTTAIACTHLYGIPVDIDAVQSLAKKHNLRVIYDAAQAHLATYKGKGLGEFGDVVTYSFYATKNLGTGEGGMVTCNDDQLAHKIQMLRSHGESGKYLHESIGFNYRMNDITGAIGLSKIELLPEQTDRRRAVAARYDAIIDGIDGVGRPRVDDGLEPAWHLYTCRLDPDKFGVDRDRFCEALKAEGVPTAVHYPRATPRQPAFDSFKPDYPPVSDALASRVFCIPIHHNLTDEQVDRIGEAIAKVADAYRK